MTRLLIATRNHHKVEEIQAILGAKFHCQALGDHPDAPGVIEDADTFAGNATKKALTLAQWISHPVGGPEAGAPEFVLADDSGLEVDALGGAPGVYSARFATLETGASENSPDAENNAKLLRLLQDVPPEKRTARFRCVIALVEIDGQQPGPVQLFDGACAGRIGLRASGPGGFGYDPLFTPTGFTGTFAELGAALKNGLSHRAQALAKLKDYFQAKCPGTA